MRYSEERTNKIKIIMSNNINIGTPIDLQNLLETRMLIQANSGGGKSVLARVIMEQAAGIVPFIVFDIDGEYYTLKEKYGDILVIGGQFADVPISNKSVKLLPKEIIGNRLSVIIDLSDLKMPERIMYVKHFLESMMELSKDYWTGYLVFIEEAHTLCGEQDKQESARAVKDLMSRGRKKGYCGILITQRISKLHKDAAAECNNKFIGRTFLDLDMDRSARELGFSNMKDRLQLRDLEPGHFYAYGTAITPNHVHEVTIKLPQTKHPKAGNVASIKPQKPTEKIKSMLTKLNDLPGEAEKELKTVQQLQGEVHRLATELKKATKPGNNSLSEKDANQIKQLQEQIKLKDGEVGNLKKAIGIYERRNCEVGQVLNELSEKLTDSHTAKERTVSLKNVTKSPQPVQISDKSVHKIETSVQKPRNVNTSGEGSLGKCSMAILQFLASFPDRSFTKAQVGIATGYSPNSGGFNNSLSELNSKGLISRDNAMLQVIEHEASTYLSPDFQPQQYSIHTYMSKLGKCEKEIYQVLLDHPEDKFSKEDLANATPSQYSHSSGGFNNALSTLNTLELIRRESGMVRLNPELLEI
jgi:hypothetical protein